MFSGKPEASFSQMKQGGRALEVLIETIEKNREAIEQIVLNAGRYMKDHPPQIKEVQRKGFAFLSIRLMERPILFSDIITAAFP